MNLEELIEDIDNKGLSFPDKIIGVSTITYHLYKRIFYCYKDSNNSRRINVYVGDLVADMKSLNSYYSELVPFIEKHKGDLSVFGRAVHSIYLKCVISFTVKYNKRTHRVMGVGKLVVEKETYKDYEPPSLFNIIKKKQ